jgi:hypothetical protein
MVCRNEVSSPSFKAMALIVTSLLTAMGAV